MKKIFLLFLVICFSSYLFAKDYNTGIIGNDGMPISITIPDALAGLMEDLGINENLIMSGVNLLPEEYKDYFKDHEKEIMPYFNIATEYLLEEGSQYINDYDVLKNTINTSFGNFSKNLTYGLIDSSSMQNTWPNSYIGHFFPGFHLGLGVDFSVATFDASPLFDLTDALGMQDFRQDLKKDFYSDIPSFLENKLIFPTASINARIGGFVLPFDIGLSFMSLDTKDISLSNDFNFKYSNIAGDVRYNFLNIGPNLLKIKASGVLGIYHTAGDLNISDPQDAEKFHYDQTSRSIGAQADVKTIFLDVFAGLKFLTPLSASTELSASPNWSYITKTSGAEAAIINSILPKEIKKSNEINPFDYFHPVIFGGLGFSLFLFKIGLGASYNFESENVGANFSIRLAI